eukprot:6214327-Pleurochrysis_carterae.AAC.2
MHSPVDDVDVGLGLGGTGGAVCECECRGGDSTGHGPLERVRAPRHAGEHRAEHAAQRRGYLDDARARERACPRAWEARPRAATTRPAEIMHS